MDISAKQREGNRRGGSSKSEAKTAASRENGKRGGRPKRVPTLQEITHTAAAAAMAQFCNEHPEYRKYLPSTEPKTPKVKTKRVRKPKPKPVKPLRGAALIRYLHEHGEYKGMTCQCPLHKPLQPTLPPDFDPRTGGSQHSMSANPS